MVYPITITIGTERGENLSFIGAGTGVGMALSAPPLSPMFYDRTPDIYDSNNYIILLLTNCLQVYYFISNVLGVCIIHLSHALPSGIIFLLAPFQYISSVRAYDLNYSQTMKFRMSVFYHYNYSTYITNKISVIAYQ